MGKYIYATGGHDPTKKHRDNPHYNFINFKLTQLEIIES